MNFDLVSLCIGGLLGAAGCYSVYGRKNAQLEAEKNAAEDKSVLHAADLSAMEEKFQLRFENLANRIFDEKSARFKTESQEGLSQILVPLRERLQEFQKKVDDSFGAQAKEQFSLKREIENIILVNAEMTRQTQSLTRALKGDVKAQGNWGEIILEKILEDSGLGKGVNYIVQGTDLGLKHAETGTVQKPDVVILLPENKHLIIDAKVSLTSYERYCAEDDEDARALHLKDFLTSIRAHVNGLEQRRYQDTDKLGTPDFVFMFLPIEGAYSLAMQKDPELHSHAWGKKIFIVCPATLMATLKTVALLWRAELQNRNTLEIARQGGNLYDKVAGFVDDMQTLGKRIGAAQETYEDAFKKLSSGRGSIVSRTEELRALGVKTSKKMPAQLLGNDEEDTLLKKVESN